MKVSHYKCDYGEGELVDYIVFPSGTVMFNPDGCGWHRSRFVREQVEDKPDMEFIGFIDAPCVEQI